MSDELGDDLGARTATHPRSTSCSPSGDPREQRHDEYLSLGLRPEDVPALIRLAGDDALWRAEGEVPRSGHRSTPGGRSAICGRRRRSGRSSPSSPNRTRMISMIGWARNCPRSSPSSPQGDPAPRGVFARARPRPLGARHRRHGLGKIAQAAPETRDTVVATLNDLLEDNASRPRPPSEREETLNGFVISELITLGAGETAPAIERAFAADRVDETIAGDLEDVQIALGLRERRDTPARHYLLDSRSGAGDELPDDELEPPSRFADLPPLPAPARPPGVSRSSAKRRVAEAGAAIAQAESQAEQEQEEVTGDAVAGIRLSAAGPAPTRRAPGRSGRSRRGRSRAGG
jgi:hypothetical protein